MERKSTNELGIAGMVLGIIAVTLSCVLFGGLVGIIGLCLSIAGIRQKEKSSGSSLAGIILNSISIFMAIITIIFFMFAFTGLESKPTISPIGNTNEKTTELPINPQPQSPPVEDLQQIPSYSAERPQPDNQISFCTIGNSIQNTIWKIDFIDAGLYDKIGDSPFQDTPKAGDQFLALFFEIENLSTTESYFNAYYFDCYIDGYVIDPALTLNDVEGYGTLFANIKPSKKHKGC